jgi:hypothetical protein
MQINQAASIFLGSLIKLSRKLPNSCVFFSLNPISTIKLLNKMGRTFQAIRSSTIDIYVQYQPGCIIESTEK